jgi:hypothetical protein
MPIFKPPRRQENREQRKCAGKTAKDQTRITRIFTNYFTPRRQGAKHSGNIRLASTLAPPTFPARSTLAPPNIRLEGQIDFTARTPGTRRKKDQDFWGKPRKTRMTRKQQKKKDGA